MRSAKPSGQVRADDDVTCSSSRPFPSAEQGRHVPVVLDCRVATAITHPTNDLGQVLPQIANPSCLRSSRMTGESANMEDREWGAHDPRGVHH